MEGQVSLFGPDSECGKTFPDVCPRDGTPQPGKRCRERTFSRSSRRSSRLKNHTFMLLDLSPGAGNMLGPYWEYDPVWLGRSGGLNSSACPKGAIESSLSLILQASVPSKYYLSRTACRGILRRAEERGKPLPPQLELALKLQAGIIRPPSGVPVSELLRTVADGRRAAAVLTAQPETEQQPYAAGCLNPWDTQQSRIFTPEGTAPTLTGAEGGGGRNPGGLVYTAGFSANAGSGAGSIGYQEELSPTLKGTQSGGMMPSVLCLNDQGGQRMEVTAGQTGTLRAQMKGHQPAILFDNHGVDARYTGPHDIAPTLSARAGTGGNNLPIALQGFEGGETVFARQRADCFQESDAASTESARQHKDATDLVLQPDGDGPAILLIRRLVPLECELLQGYPPGWTDLPGASDSARFRALGNSVAIPCVEYLMQGIALVIRAGL